jgi:hypothetical protein
MCRSPNYYKNRQRNIISLIRKGPDRKSRGRSKPSFISLLSLTDRCPPPFVLPSPPWPNPSRRRRLFLLLRRRGRLRPNPLLLLLGKQGVRMPLPWLLIPLPRAARIWIRGRLCRWLGVPLYSRSHRDPLFGVCCSSTRGYGERRDRGGGRRSAGGRAAEWEAVPPGRVERPRRRADGLLGTGILLVFRHRCRSDAPATEVRRALL